MNKVVTKACSICGGERPLSMFNFQEGAKDGLKSFCKVCDSLQAQEYYEANKDKIKAKVKKYQEKKKNEQNPS